MKILEIENDLKKLSIEELNKGIEKYKDDERLGVVKLLQKYEKKMMSYQKEKQEWQEKCGFDRSYHQQSLTLAGVDEVGRGPLAGPVVAAAVILSPEAKLIGVKDSKKLSEERREELYDAIIKEALAIGIGIIEAPIIDEINILQATFEAMRQALHYLKKPYDYLLVDGDKTIPCIEVSQSAVIKGDDKSASIAAASIIAKVTRDRLMREYAKEYPGYDWENNKGYGSSRHYEAIQRLGLTPLHRKSFLKNEGID
ncbi:ribonuclease HII [Sporanaerobium hydrogeniformans]|uniref:Ribonuclease HII n=1 Tax=Sporanaerobium hydrogeniformans TaxID=3072179 RepID=A0AC61DD05_9FIRM|nr:ribonuclease HII [Sporanaerobium hydrogeniformans]PHV71124.1 ribonuclease HII [Sporanaerobium hydrogeniformans]